MGGENVYRNRNREASNLDRACFHRAGSHWKLYKYEGEYNEEGS